MTEMVTHSANHNVQPNEWVGWEIVRAGERRAADFDPTKEGAVEKARKMTRREGGGEVRVINDLGRVVESEKVRALPWSRRAAA